jgi:4-hydroxy-4-methyl-2-oxoglutarate aldolase
MAGCNLLSHKAIYVAQPGDVIVFDARGHVDTSVWGYLQTRACQIRQLAGVVIDGSVRDSAEIRKSGFPVFCAGVSSLGPHKGWADRINVPIQCGGVPVVPGDIIIGDDDGVVVVPKGSAERVAQIAHELLELEKSWFTRLEKGETTLSILDLDTKIKALGERVV